MKIRLTDITRDKTINRCLMKQNEIFYKHLLD